MAVVGELLVLIGANTGPLTAGLTKAEAELKGFSAASSTHGGAIGTAFNGIRLAAIGVGVAALAGTGIAIKAAADFQDQLAIINTIAHQTPEELNKTGESIRKMAVESGTSLPDLTGAFYDLLSAGISTKDAINVLGLANTLAIGGLATTKQTVDLLTTAINAYGLDAKGAAVATDQFALAVQDGKVTADQIAATFADIAPIARTAGIGIDEISASYAFLTARGVPASEVTTQMNRAIVELLKPNKDLLALQEKTGISFANVASQKGLVVALQDMRAAAAAAGIPFQDLFGRLEGYKFALATTGPAFAGYTSELVKMHSANGTAAAQAAERMGTFNRQMAILGNTILDIGITIGNQFLPSITAFVGSVREVVGHIAAWAAANPGLTSNLLLLAIAIGAVAAVSVVIPAVLGFLLGPIGLIGAAVAGLYLVWQNNWFGIRDVVASVVGFIGPLLSAAFSTITGLISDFTDGSGAFIDDINEMAVRGEPLGVALKAIGDGFTLLRDIIGTIAHAIGDPGHAVTILQGQFGSAGHVIVAVMGQINGVIQTAAGMIGDALGYISRNVLPPLRELFGYIVVWVQQNWPTISTIVRQVAGAVSTLVQVMAHIVAAAFVVMVNAVQIAWPVLVGFGRVVFPIIGAAASVLLSVITIYFGAIGAIWQGVANIARDMGADIKVVWTAVGAAIGVAVGVATGFINALIGVVSTVAAAIAGFFGWLFPKVGEAKGALAGLSPGGFVTHPLAVKPPATAPVAGYHGAGSTAYTPPVTTVGGVPVAGMFQHGGIVPGIGAQLIVAHGGETVSPAGRGPVTLVNHNHIYLDGERIAEFIDRKMFGSASGFSSGFTSPNPVTGA